MNWPDELDDLEEEIFGESIQDIQLEEAMLTIFFSDGRKLCIFDNGQSCCENRYMHTDDDLSYYVGAQLLGFTKESSADDSTEYGEIKESEFLIVLTTKGKFTVVNYNEHNGYYGGFNVVAKVV